MELKACDLVTHLARNGVIVSVKKVNVGPMMTQYCLELDDWAQIKKVEKIFSATPVRVALVPKQKLLGLEFWNADVRPIYLNHLLQNVDFVNSRHKIPVAVGVDVAGNPVYYDLTKMPHILITGRTGAGKTTFLQSILASIKAKFSPDKCKMVVVDTKGVDFNNWDTSPYMIRPVVKLDVGAAIKTLEWVVDEMDNRYRQMCDKGVRNITDYNAQADKGHAMPYIVVVVDEFADLMCADRKKVESCVQSITQKARCAGIHLIMATQRAENGVLTGIIKANFPTRVAFQARNYQESLKTLGEGGAEKLMRCGDMLFSEAGRDPVRIHGATVEVDLYARAKEIVVKNRQPRIAYLQRKLNIGYNKAAEFIEQMQQDGIITAPDENNKRYVI